MPVMGDDDEEPPFRPMPTGKVVKPKYVVGTLMAQSAGGSWRAWDGGGCDRAGILAYVGPNSFMIACEGIIERAKVIGPVDEALAFGFLREIQFL